MRPYSRKAPQGVPCGAFLKSRRRQSVEVPLDAHGEMIAVVADLGEAAGIDVMSLLIAIFREQTRLFGGGVFRPAYCLPAQNGRAAVIAHTTVDIGIDRT